MHFFCLVALPFRGKKLNPLYDGGKSEGQSGANPKREQRFANRDKTPG